MHKVLITLKKIILASFSLLFCWLTTTSLSGNNKYFHISKEDIAFNIPVGFPIPFYDFGDNELSPETFLLGRMLFYDPILSRDSTISCASCHQRLFAFGHVDHALSHGINGLIGKRNVPALQNLVWQQTYMWDGGINHLELQPLSPMTNNAEMDETVAGVIAKLRRNDHYPGDFNSAFHDTGITTQRILRALAQFTGLMISANSKYDKYRRGEDTLSNTEAAGLKLFREKCVVCHAEPLFTNNAFMNNGLRVDTSLNDFGRGRITGIDSDNYKFKVPSLRNVERTYPYMHDGRFRSLKNVLDFYGNPINFDANADRNLKKIGVISDSDKNHIIAFLLTLTDKSFLYDRRFIDPFIK